MFTFHLLGVPHIPTHKDYSSCAYTQKVVKLAKMLKDLGHTVIFYGGEGSSVVCDEFVQVVSHDLRVATYGDYDWRAEFFKFSGNDAVYRTFCRNAILEIQRRKEPHDFILTPMGWDQKPVADAFPDMLSVEPGIGYRGIYSNYKVFESYAWMHFLYGLNSYPDGDPDGRYYDTVIPNFFDPNDFPMSTGKDDYLLYIGRLIDRKGVAIAAAIAHRLKKLLVLAGQGDPTKLNLVGEWYHVGSVSGEERAKLMGRAQAVLMPTVYLEPFGGVAVEAMMCGTPVVTSDWGAFPETVLHGVTGYRCRTLQQFVDAAEKAPYLNRLACRTWAVHNYSTDRVKYMYQEYFERLNDLWTDGWYRVRHSNLWYLTKYYPGGFHVR